MMLLLATELAKTAPTGGEGVKSGPLGLAIILVLCVACYFLFKSMSKHMRKVREGFPSDEPAPTVPASKPATGDEPAAQVEASAEPAAKAPPSDSA